MSLPIDVHATKLTSRFYGVYLLCSQSTEKHYKGKCYIGFTVNPSRRIRQHNRGKEFGGAKKTNNKGPWRMILIVHGFPNNIAALQFEWAWQQPSLSSRLKSYPELKRKLAKETYFEYNFRVLSRMLNEGPWLRLPLVVEWLEPDYICEFEQSFQPPSHMKIITESTSWNLPLVGRRQSEERQSSYKPNWSVECHLCMKTINDVKKSCINCLNNVCQLTCHIICLANYFLSLDANQKGHYIPIKGKCPLCETVLLWTDLMQQKRHIIYPNADYKGMDSDDEENIIDVLPL